MTSTCSSQGSQGSSASLILFLLKMLPLYVRESIFIWQLLFKLLANVATGLLINL